MDLSQVTRSTTQQAHTHSPLQASTSCHLENSETCDRFNMLQLFYKEGFPVALGHELPIHPPRVHARDQLPPVAMILVVNY
ncbi:hypothetical protein TNCV_3311701 [Trichonephila clavipes]|nr:hypothetical protein TNCV_3311701 [Trichonephila clavipes]